MKGLRASALKRRLEGRYGARGTAPSGLGRRRLERRAARIIIIIIFDRTVRGLSEFYVLFEDKVKFEARRGVWRSAGGGLLTFGTFSSQILNFSPISVKTSMV